jgi:hypothetical protein
LRANETTAFVPPLDWFAARQVLNAHGPRLYVCSVACYEEIKDRGTMWTHVDERFKDVLVGAENCRWCAKYRHGTLCPTHARSKANAKAKQIRAAMKAEEVSNG